MNRNRVQTLNQGSGTSGRYVLYWMQQSQRAWQNPALEYAIRSANQHELPVVVTFGLAADYPEANRRHFAFLLQGLPDVAERLEERNVTFLVRRGSPPQVALDLARNAALVVCDRGYLRHQKKWRRELASGTQCSVVQVEGDVVVPVDCASDKQEYAARTLRPKILRQLGDYMVELTESEVEKDGADLDLESDVDLFSIDETLDSLNLDSSVPPVRRFQGGTREARRRLTAFLRSGFRRYHDQSSNPADPVGSTLSPYLHFGQISPVEVALKVDRAKGGSKDDREGFLEELIVRRELAANFVHRCRDYDRFTSLPEWARKTLTEHEDDERDSIYTRSELENAETHDPYWNAAMKEMVTTGFMHNYMRMYWGKKILEWTNTPEYGYRTTLYLNNKYFLDGRDPSSYANVAWCYGLHDRAWQERQIFGKIRYMNRNGLERKFDMDAYCERVEELAAEEAGDTASPE